MSERHLLIDDERDFGPMRTARNYHEGILALQEEVWDVLWLDYDMGVGCYTGMDVLTWLENNPQHLPKTIQMITISVDYRKKMQLKAAELYGKVPRT